ncbi:MAG TPA: outer membrane beta-barrel protein [Spirochaetia bacterium]|nr:outer membrane beta-barrel protein [Spirochaetia bacterium]
MKGLVITILILTLVASLAFADGAPRGGEFGIQGNLSLPFTGTIGSPNGSVGGKYFFTDTIALRAALGFASSSAGGTSTLGYDLAAGFEYHLNGKNGVSPYVGAEMSYSGYSISTGGSTDSDFGLRGVFGAEYYFSNSFSWGGELGLGLDSAYSALSKTTTTTVGTVAFRTTLTWYLN